MGVSIKAELQRSIGDDLSKLQNVAPQILAGALAHVSLEVKNSVKETIERTFPGSGLNAFRPPQRSNKAHMLREVRFDSIPKRVRIPNRYKVVAPKLGSIYEHNGADIFPVNSTLLRWRNQAGKWMSSNFVHIDPKPFFYPTLQRFVSSGGITRSVDEALDYQLKKNRIGTPENN